MAFFSRKRVYAFAPSNGSSTRPFKRARFAGTRSRFGRYRVGKGVGRSAPRNTISNTQQFGNQTLQYVSRRVPARAWRKALWDSTLTKSHYRSRNTIVTTQTTGTTAGTGSVSQSFAESGAAATDSFWLSANGAQEIDVGSGVPTFNSDIILRGGKIGMTMSVLDAVTDTILVRCWLVFTNADPDVAVLTTPQSMAWDPSSSADFATRYGTIVAYKQAYLKYNQSVFTMEHRVRPRKIDANVHEVAGKSYVWLTHAVNLTSTTDVTVNKYKTYNFSFSGDAIT